MSQTNYCTCPHGDDNELEHDSNCPGRIIKELKQKLQAAENRPPMSCRTCEEANQELAEKLDKYEGWKIEDKRESLAWNTWLEASGFNDSLTVEELLNTPAEKLKPVKEKFDKWWENNKYFQ
jgi:hypothetical protein